MILSVDYVVQLDSGPWKVGFNLSANRICVSDPTGEHEVWLDLENRHQDGSMAIRLAKEAEGRLRLCELEDSLTSTA